jgi:hypothetical protein
MMVFFEPNGHPVPGTVRAYDAAAMLLTNTRKKNPRGFGPGTYTWTVKNTGDKQ